MTSTLRQLLVHLDATPACEWRLAIANTLAQQHGASVTGLYAAMPQAMMLPYAPEAAAAAIVDLDRLDRERQETARQIWQRAPGTAWSEAVRLDIIDVFARQALYADLLVLGQRDPKNPDSIAVPDDFVTSVIVGSGRPALVLPHAAPQRPIGQTIAIAWKPTREAARAVAAAMPLLQRARAVHVLSWGDTHKPEVEGEALNLDTLLQRHGVQANWSRGGPEPKDIGEMILSRSFDVGADLLVMGCYGHSRAREWALGGASRTLLGSMTLPVLMAH